MFRTKVNPMDDDHGMEDWSKQILGNLIKNSISVQFETRSRGRIAVLPSKVACNRPLRHTTSFLQRESGMHALPKGTLDSKSTTGCTKIEFANWSARST